MTHAGFLQRRLRFPLFLLPLVLLLLTGCGRKGTISGKVFVDDEPMPGGSITFIPADASKSVRTGIDEDGSYRAENVPSGTAKVVVVPRKAPGAGGAGGPGKPGGPGGPAPAPGPGMPQGGPPGAGGMGPPAGVADLPPEAKKRFEQAHAGGGKTVSIPAKYEDAEKTPLTYDVKGGTQQQDFKIPSHE